MTSEAPMISVIIVTYKSEDYILFCLDSIYKSEPLHTEVIIVDNNSDDSTVPLIGEHYPKVKIIKNQENLGFAKGCNIGARHASGDIIYFLNPDCIVSESAISKMAAQAILPDVGIVGPLLIDGKGQTLLESAREIPSDASALIKILKLPLEKRYPYYRTIELENAIDAPVLCGASMCVKTALFNEVGGFDEDFFMYGEDIDLSVRVLGLGYRNICESAAKVIHFKGESSNKLDLGYHDHFYKALEIYKSKHGDTSSTSKEVGVSLLSSGLTWRGYLWEHGSRLISVIGDSMIIIVCLFLVQFLWSWVKSGSFLYYGRAKYLLIYIILTSLWILCLALAGTYLDDRQRKSTFLGACLGSVAVILLYAFLPESFRFSRMITLISSVLIPFFFLLRYRKADIRQTYLCTSSRELSQKTSDLYMPIGVEELKGLNQYNQVLWDIRSYGYEQIIEVMQLQPLSHRFLDPIRNAIWYSDDPAKSGDRGSIQSYYQIGRPTSRLHRRLWDLIVAVLLIPFIFFLPLYWRGRTFYKLRGLFLGKYTIVGYSDRYADLPPLPTPLIDMLDGKGVISDNTKVREYALKYTVSDDIFITITSIPRLFRSIL